MKKLRLPGCKAKGFDDDVGKGSETSRWEGQEELDEDEAENYRTRSIKSGILGGWIAHLADQSTHPIPALYEICDSEYLFDSDERALP